MIRLKRMISGRVPNMVIIFMSGFPFYNKQVLVNSLQSIVSVNHQSEHSCSFFDCIPSTDLIQALGLAPYIYGSYDRIGTSVDD